MENKHYIELIEKFLLGLTSKEETELLQTWILTPEAKRSCYSQFKEEWDSLSFSMDKQKQATMLEQLLNKIEDNPKSVNIFKKISLRTKLIHYTAVASVSILIALGVFLWMGHYINSSSEGNMITIAAESGQRSNVILADGTKVYINSDSKLYYDESYNKKDRIVTLEGEAYFEVAKNEKKAFVVKAKGIDIEALGTSFNVKAYKEDKSISVILIEGKVKVEDNNREEILNPYERIDYSIHDEKFIKTELHPNANHLLWRSKELIFEGESLEEISQSLHRIYNVNFVFKTEAAKKYTYRGIIKNSSLDNIMEFISRTAPIKYSVLSDNTIIIEENNY